MSLGTSKRTAFFGAIADLLTRVGHIDRGVSDRSVQGSLRGEDNLPFD